MAFHTVQASRSDRTAPDTRATGIRVCNTERASYSMLTGTLTRVTLWLTKETVLVSTRTRTVHATKVSGRRTSRTERVSRRGLAVRSIREASGRTRNAGGALLSGPMETDTQGSLSRTISVAGGSTSGQTAVATRDSGRTIRSTERVVSSHGRMAADMKGNTNTMKRRATASLCGQTVFSIGDGGGMTSKMVKVYS